MAKRIRRKAKPPAPPPLVGTDLFDFLEEHLTYEVESVGAACAVIARNPSNQPEHRFGLECLLLHSRNLHEFLSKRDRGPHKTTVLGVDASAWEPQDIFDPLQLPLVHRMLAHIADDRLLNAGTRWLPYNVAHKTLSVTEAWSATLPDGTCRTQILNTCAWARSFVL